MGLLSYIFNFFFKVYSLKFSIFSDLEFTYERDTYGVKFDDFNKLSENVESKGLLLNKKLTQIDMLF